MAAPSSLQAAGLRAGRPILAALTIAIWAGLARLAWAFVDRQLDWQYVAEQSRPGLPWYYRLAGVWAGMEGSLLLFAGLLGLVAVAASRRTTTGVTWAATATVGTLALAGVVLASPFRRLDVPAVSGFGMNPILEHPAMTIHPPVLYLGLASAGAAAMATAGSREPWKQARPWHLASVGLLTAAMALGGAWSYLEQGWGGYWAWDPVENTSLLVWLAGVVALHAGPTFSGRAVLATGMLPWALALCGSILVRSGITPSIHGFAEQPGIGWALLGLTVATVAAMVARTVRAPAGRARPAVRRDRRDVTIALAAAAVIVVLAGTMLPVLSEVTGGRSSAVRGEFFSRTVGPMALVALPYLIGRLRHWKGWSTVAHGGVVVLVLGVAATTFDRVETVPIPGGLTVTAAGIDVRNDGVVVRPGPQPGTEAVEATLRAGGTTLRPKIVVHPARGGRLAEVAARPGPWRDALVVLDRADDSGGVVVTVHTRPLMWTVWLGAAIVAVATLGSAVASAVHSGLERRARLRAKRSSTVRVGAGEGA